MDTRTSSHRIPFSLAALPFAAALLAATLPAGAGAQTVVSSEPALTAVVTEQGRVDASVVSRAVLINADDVELLARRWYRSLGGASTLGDGTIVVHTRVVSDGTVAEARVPVAGPHHPALNGLARRLAATMRFAPFGADGSTLTPDQLGSAGYWVAHRISFRP